MAVTSGFFNSLNGDRKYDAKQMSSLFEGVVTDGVSSVVGDAMAVKASNGNTISIGSGRAWFDNIWVDNDTTLFLATDPAEVVLNRIDLIVIEINTSDAVRNSFIKIIKGTASSTPVRKALVKTEFIKQYALASIYKKAGATGVVQADITDLRGTAETPYIANIVNDADKLDGFHGDDYSRKFTIRGVGADTVLKLLQDNYDLFPNNTNFTVSIFKGQYFAAVGHKTGTYSSFVVSSYDAGSIWHIYNANGDWTEKKLGYFKSPSDLLTELKTVDGTGSYLDADQVDGIHATNLARNHNISIPVGSGFDPVTALEVGMSAVTKRFGISGEIVFVESESVWSYVGYAYNTTTASFIVHKHMSGEIYHIYRRADGWIKTPIPTTETLIDRLKTVDGSESGLDADLLDGVHALTFARNHSISFASGTPRTGGLEYLLTAAVLKQANIGGQMVIAGDTYYHYSGFIYDTKTASFILHSWAAGKIWHMYRTSSGWTETQIPTSPANVIDLVKQVDGSGSGLDADLFDGLESTAFSRHYNKNVAAGTTKGVALQSLFAEVPKATSISGFINIDADGSYQYTGVVYSDIAASFIVHNWTSGNTCHVYRTSAGWTENQIYSTPADMLADLKKVDGTNSGLDSDLLDGRQGSSYAWNENTIVSSSSTVSAALQALLSKIQIGIAASGRIVIDSLRTYGYSGIVYTATTATFIVHSSSDGFVYHVYRTSTGWVEKQIVEMPAVWTSMGLINGWTGAAQYFIDSNGIVHLKGRLYRGETTMSGTAFAIPSAAKFHGLEGTMPIMLAYQPDFNSITGFETGYAYVTITDGYFRVVSTKLGFYNLHGISWPSV